jgi:hypothetical protein
VWFNHYYLLSTREEEVFTIIIFSLSINFDGSGRPVLADSRHAKDFLHGPLAHAQQSISRASKASFHISSTIVLQQKYGSTEIQYDLVHREQPKTE